MRIVVSNVAGMQPLVMENMTAVILAADDGKADGTAPVVARGKPERIAELAAVMLVAIRHKLGDDVFEAVVRSARNDKGRVSEITDSMRLP